MVQPKAPLVTEAEIADINVVGAPILPLHGSAEDDPIVDFYGTYTAPPPARWRVFLRDVWFWLTKSRR